MNPEWSKLLQMPPERFGRVGVLMGGQSAERAISMESGHAVHVGLQQAGIDAHSVVCGQGLPAELLNRTFDRVFIALHGRGGEDGQLQSVLEYLGTPYTGTGVLGSALGMHKIKSKQVVASAGVPTPPYVLLRSQADCDTAWETLGAPMVVKPASEGSSLGVSKVESREQLEAAWRAAKAFDDDVLAEGWVSGQEVTVGIVADVVLPSILLQTKNAFYDYNAKYESNETRYICPAGLSEATETLLGRYARTVFSELKLCGWGRVDFMLDGAGKPYFIEVNTVPGMTSHSLIPMAAAQAGLSFSELVKVILAGTLETDG